MLIKQRIQRLRPWPDTAKFLNAAWPLWEGAGQTVHDATGRLQNGAFSSNGTPSWVNGRGGPVLYFPGNGSQTGSLPLSCGNVCDFATQSFSWTVWCKYGTSFGNNYPGLVSKAISAASPHQTQWGAYVWSGSPAGAPYVQICDSSSNNAQVIWGSAISDSKWHLIGCYVDRVGNLLALSVDVQPFSTASTSSVGSLANTASLSFGCRPDDLGTAHNQYIGYLDDVRVYANYVIRLSDLSAMYQYRG